VIARELKTGRMKQFSTGFLYIFFLAINTVFLGKSNYWGAFTVSIIIGYLWTGNVKRVHISTEKERMFYCIGSGFGAIVGLFFTQYCKVWINIEKLIDIANLLTN